MTESDGGDFHHISLDDATMNAFNILIDSVMR